MDHWSRRQFVQGAGMVSAGLLTGVWAAARVSALRPAALWREAVPGWTAQQAVCLPSGC
jgi:hypothetical protein